VAVAPDSAVRLTPTERWQSTTLALAAPEYFHVDENYFVETKRVEQAGAAAAGTSR
jgi:hypothetical protein